MESLEILSWKEVVFLFVLISKIKEFTKEGTVGHARIQFLYIISIIVQRPNDLCNSVQFEMKP